MLRVDRKRKNGLVWNKRKPYKTAFKMWKYRPKIKKRSFKTKIMYLQATYFDIQIQEKKNCILGVKN